MIVLQSLLLRLFARQHLVPHRDRAERAGGRVGVCDGLEPPPNILPNRFAQNSIVILSFLLVRFFGWMLFLYV